jgi:HWE histidine kinase
MNDFADRIECIAPMAVRSRIMNAPWPHIERPDGSRGVALVDIEAVKDSDGNIVGAVNCFQDITERKQSEEREKTLAGEVDHRAKNLLALVQATVHLTHADTVEDFKAAIEGRLQALSNAHTLLAQSGATRDVCFGPIADIASEMKEAAS